MESDNKIKVFISSKCDDPTTGNKYSNVRTELKRLIEDTGLAEVYVFEEESSSTLSARNHYSYALEDSDVCVFLIDNADGIPEGVKNEIHIVQKCHIQSLYFFCDENSKEKTDFEKGILTADNAKSRTIHKFSDLCGEGSKALINDITKIYHYYCRGKLLANESDSNESDIAASLSHNMNDASFPKSVMKQTESTTDYLYQFVMRTQKEKIDPVNEYDRFARLFLEVLLEGRSISEINATLFLEKIKEYQNNNLYEAVKLRWEAIQAFYADHIENCLLYLDESLEFSKKNNLPQWFINDLLIDIRNVHLAKCIIDNRHSVSPAQEELESVEEQLHYPVVDRVNETLFEKFTQGLYKETIKSPHTISIGNNIHELVRLISTSYIVALYFGSLTHIRLLTSKLKELFFYLTTVYDDWRFKYSLFKLAIYEGDNKEIRELRSAYPEILNNLSSDEATEIVDFCCNPSLDYLRIKTRIRAFSFVGYYLNDIAFNRYLSVVEDDIEKWLADPNHTIAIGQNFFDSITEVAYRLSQEKLAVMCCRIMRMGWSIYYNEMFKFIGKIISLKNLSNQTASELINLILHVSEDSNTRNLIPIETLIRLRKQDSSYSLQIDECVCNYYNSFYETYMLETTEDISFTNNYYSKIIERILVSQERQKTQAVNATTGNRDYYTLFLLLKNSNVIINESLVTKSLTAIDLALNNEHCSIRNKVDSVLLACYIKMSYLPVEEKWNSLYDNILSREEQILNVDFDVFDANIDLLALKCILKIMSVFTKESDFVGLVELLSLAKNDVATVLCISNFVADLLDGNYIGKMGNDVEWLLIVNSLEWMHINNNEITINKHSKSLPIFPM